MTTERHSADEIVTRLSSEIRRVSAGLSELEFTTIAALRGSEAGISADMMVALQDFDMMLQTMNAISGFLDDIARALPTGTEVETGPALRRIPLQDLSERLGIRAKTGCDHVVDINRNGSTPQLF